MDLDKAIQYFRPYIRQANENYEDDYFLFNSFEQFSPAVKYEFIYNLLFFADSIEFAFGSVGLSVLSPFLNNKELISQFDEQQRYALAQMAIARTGIRHLDLYQLSEAQTVAITEEAREKVRAFLPPIISDEEIAECIRTHDLASMRQHIFTRFGDKAAIFDILLGVRTPILGLDLVETLTKIQHLDALTDDLPDTLQTAMRVQEAYFLQYGWYRNSRPVSKRPSQWGSKRGVQPEDNIDFSHGGGFFYILKFLKGETQGYRLERPGVGLQVSPQTLEHERDNYYSGKAYRYFDYPARLSGRIQAQYLDSANNGYEAGLRSDFRGFLEHITMTRFDTGVSFTIKNIEELPMLEAFFKASIPPIPLITSAELEQQMVDETETYLPADSLTTKTVFFRDWLQRSKRLRSEEFITAKVFFEDIDIDFRSNFLPYFETLAPEAKFIFVRNFLLVQNKLEYFFGSMGARRFHTFKQQFPRIISQFDESQRYALAQIDIAKGGTAKLPLYQLSEEQAVTIVNEAREKIQAYLPARISDELIEECIRNNDRELLRASIYNRFGDIYYISNVILNFKVTILGVELVTTLSKLQNLDKLTDDLQADIQLAMQVQEAFFLQYGWLLDPQLPVARPERWKKSTTNPEALIEFSHGGGFFYILKFLKGETRGYRLERAGTGIQVSPQTLAHSRDEFYSGKAYRHFDYPARFSARIKAKYLDSANNGYEAGLRPEFIEFLEDITIKRFDTGATYTIKSIEELAALEAFFRAHQISATTNQVMNRSSVLPMPSTATLISHPENVLIQSIVASDELMAENAQTVVTVPSTQHIRPALRPPELSRDSSSESLYSVSISSETPVSSEVTTHRSAPIFPLPSLAVQARNNSFYLLWMAAVIFAIVSLIALCWALNVLLAPTLGMGPMAIAVAAALFIKTTPFYLSLIYTATSAATGLIAIGLFKTRERPVEVDPELALARMEWERIQTMRSN